MDKSTIEKEIVSLVTKEITNWETAEAFITEKVSYNMRNLIRQCRKNYWGIFDQPIDPTTNREKIWIPLTESTVESSVKSIDLDTKDINFRAKKQSALGLTAIVRSAVKNLLDKIMFGEILDDMERRLAIDGTAVWYTGEKKDEDGRPTVDIRQVDLLNFYIDPTAHSIQETPAVIERIIVDISEFRRLAEDNEWINADEVQGQQGINRNDPVYNGAGVTTTNQIPQVAMFKRVGLAPKYFLTGEEEDRDEYEHMEIVLSGDVNKYNFHGAEKLESEIKPYEEAWYTRVPGRWYGRGISEKLMMLQLYLNAVVNVRINRAYISQLGIFKIRRGAGITAQMISRLASNGAILVNDIDDIEQFQMQDASPASYNDEQVVKDWAQRVTASYEVVTGESLPASTTATAVSLQGRNAESQFALIKEGIGMFLQRWLKRHAIPIIMKNLRKGDIIRLTGEPELLADFDERIANQLVLMKLDEIFAQGGFVDPMQVEMERQRVISGLQALGKDRYVELQEDIDFTEYDVQVYITNEEFDKGVMIQNLINMLQVIPAIPNAGVDPANIVRQALDLMGLDSVAIGSVKNNPMMQPQPQTSTGTTAQDMTTRSNTMANAPRK